MTDNNLLPENVVNFFSDGYDFSFKSIDKDSVIKNHEVAFIKIATIPVQINLGVKDSWGVLFIKPINHESYSIDGDVLTIEPAWSWVPKLIITRNQQSTLTEQR